MNNPCVGERTVARVQVDELVRIDGQPDRKITVTRDCGHTYFAGRRLVDVPPEIGERAMRCPGPIIATPIPRPAYLDGPIIDERKRPTKRGRPRKEQVIV